MPTSLASLRTLIGSSLSTSRIAAIRPAIRVRSAPAATPVRSRDRA
jgi:hypothetical protein